MLHNQSQTRYTRSDTSGRVISPAQRPVHDNTQHSQKTDIYAPGGIGTRIPIGEFPQAHALDRAMTGNGQLTICMQFKTAI